MAERPRLIPFGDDAWTFKGAKHPYVSKKKARKALKKMYPKVKAEKKVTILYNVRDATGKMIPGVTESQKDKIVKAGGTVVNVIRPRGYKPPPPVEVEVPPEEVVVAPEEVVVPPEVEVPPEEVVVPPVEVVVAPPEVKVETPAEKVAREAREAAAEEALIMRIGPVAAAAEIARQEAIKVDEATRKAAEVAARIKEQYTAELAVEAATVEKAAVAEVSAAGKLALATDRLEKEVAVGVQVAIQDVRARTETEAPQPSLDVVIASTRSSRDTSAQNIDTFKGDIGTYQQTITTAKADKQTMMSEYDQIRVDYQRAMRNQDKYTPKSIRDYTKSYNEYVSNYNANLIAYDKYISDLEAGIATTEENIGIEQTNIRSMDKFLANPTKGATYTVTYTEDGVSKTKTFKSEVEANVFYTLLDKVTVSYTEDGVTKTKSFKTQKGADDFLNTWQDRVMADAKFTGTWAAFQTQQVSRAAALSELATKGLIAETEVGTFEITKPLSTISAGDLETIKEAGFDPVFPVPWLEQLFPQLADLRDKAEFQRFPLWDSMTDQEKKDLILSSSRGRMEPVPWETSAARLQYAGIYAAEGAAVAGAVGALVATVPQLGVPIAASMVLGMAATIVIPANRAAFLDYVKLNPEAFTSEVLGGVIGAAAVSKVIKARKPQVTKMQSLEKMVEGTPDWKAKQTIIKEIGDIIGMERDPITGEELIIGRLKETREGWAGGVFDEYVALKYGPESFAKIMNNDPLGEHFVLESIMPKLTPENLGYLSSKGYSQKVLSHMTGLELAQTMFKELGAGSPWAQIPEGILRKGGGTLDVISILRPLTEAQSSALVGQGQTVFTTMTAGGVPQSLALQTTQIAMTQGAASAYAYAQLSGLASLEMLAVIEASLSPVAASMFSTTSKGSFTQTLRDLGLSDSEALLVTTELIKGDKTANIVKSLKTLKGTELKGYTPSVDKGLLLESISKLDVKTAQKVVKTLDTKTIIELAPKIDKNVLNPLIIAIEKEELGKVVSKLDTATIKKFDDKTLEKIAKELDIKTLEGIMPTLDFYVMKKVFPKLDLDKKELRDMLDKLDAKTKKNIEDVLVKLDRATLKSVMLNLNKDFVSDIDKKALRDILEELDRETLEKFVTRYGAESVARTIDKETIEYASDLLRKLRGKQLDDIVVAIDDIVITELVTKLAPEEATKLISSLDKERLKKISSKIDTKQASELLRLLRGDRRQDLVEVLTDDMVAKIITKIESKQAADLLSGLSKEKLKRVINKVETDKISDLFRVLRGDRRDDVIAVLSDNTIAELVSKFTMEQAGDLLSKIDKEKLGRVIPKLDTKTLANILPMTDVYTRIDTKLLMAALARLDKKEIAVIIPTIITELDKDTIIDIVPILDTKTLTDVIPMLDTDVIADVLSALDTDVISDVITVLDTGTITDVLPILDPVTIETVITGLDATTITEVIIDLDADTLTTVITTLDQSMLLKVRALLEKDPRALARIMRMLPLVLRRKFEKARRRPPPKIPRSKEPEPYKIGFRYHTGASETERVDAHTFHEALVIAEKRKKIKLVPVEVEVEKLELRR